MRAVYKKNILTFLISFGIGGGAILLVAKSGNGYLAGFIFFPIFILIAISSLLLVIVGLILLGSKEKSAPRLLLTAFLIPASFVSSGLIAKYFEIGAYREEPIIPFNEGVNNIVVFKAGATNDQIEDFWHKTISIEQADGRGSWPLPGIRDLGRNQSRNGREIIVFGFFPNATEEQKQFVFAKVKSSPIVYQLLENQSMKEEDANSEGHSAHSNSNENLKKDESTTLVNSK